MKVEFVDSQREAHGVQPVLQALEQTPAQIAPSTYYAAKSRPPSARAARDRELGETSRRPDRSRSAGHRRAGLGGLGGLGEYFGLGCRRHRGSPPSGFGPLVAS